MNPQSPNFIFILFPAMWLGITTLLGFLSGWFGLMMRYPDKDEIPLLKLTGQTGWMNLGVSMKGILTLSACPSGLRVGMSRILGPFCRNFFVPWEEIRVERKHFLWIPTAVLNFGDSSKLSMEAHVANRLWRAAQNRWPEPGPVPDEETPQQAFQAIFKMWLALTTFASIFFLVVPRLASQGRAVVPAAVAILFPAIVVAIGCAFQYWQRTKHLEK